MISSPYATFKPDQSIMKCFHFRDVMGGHVITVHANNSTEALEQARLLLTSPRPVNSTDQ